MSLESLKIEYDKMQQIYGDKKLKSINFGGCEKNPDICFVFMNPTSKNIASDPSWNGIRAPWIGTKNIWDLFVATDLFDTEIYNEIKSKKANEWDKYFAEKVYNEVKIIYSLLIWENVHKLMLDLFQIQYMKSI